MIFKFADKVVRVVGTADKPYWVARDVAEILGISQSTLSERLANMPASWKDEFGLTDTIGRKQMMVTVSEAGLYELIFRADKPEARSFQRWVFEEVLPAIRKTGRYELNAVARDLAAENAQLKQNYKRLHGSIPAGSLTLGAVAKMHGLYVVDLLRILAENGEMRIIENFCKVSQYQRIVKDRLNKIEELVDRHRRLHADTWQLGLLDELDEFKPNLDLFDGEV